MSELRLLSHSQPVSQAIPGWLSRPILFQVQRPLWVKSGLFDQHHFRSALAPRADTQKMLLNASQP